MEVPQTSTSIGKKQWTSLIAAMLGWTLDAMDWMMLALALPHIQNTFGITLAKAGLLSTATLAGAAIGGIIVGIIADYLGRVRVLMFTMAWYAIFTALCGFAQSWEQLMVLRFIVGIGLGGEWGVGAALVSEYWPAQHRAKATSLVHSGWPVGYGLAALLYILLVPNYGWRSLFFAGILPAFIAIWVRLSVPEPEAWLETRASRQDNAVKQPSFPLATLFSLKYVRLTLLAMLLASGALMAYWGAATWLPSFLAKAKGLNIVKTGTYLIVLNAGAFFGYQFFGWLADTRGRRTAFTLGMTLSIIAVLVYVSIKQPSTLLLFGPVYGFITYGFFGNFGAFISELFPTEARATATNLVFNFGRGMSMLSPYIIGLVGQKYGLGVGLGVTAVFYLIGVIAVLLLPETAHKRDNHTIQKQ